MITADLLCPWWDVEIDGVRDQRRLPQFLHDAGDMPFRDITAQASEIIPPSPGLAVWRVWPTQEQYDAILANAAYTVLRSAEVERAHADPAAWPACVATAGRAEASDAFPTLPAMGEWVEAYIPYQYAGEAWIARQAHSRTEHEPWETPALWLRYRLNAAETQDWVPAEQVEIGYKRVYEGVVYVCRRAHPTQFPPPLTPELWGVYQDPDVPAPWVQPTGAHDAYQPPTRVIYQGNIWECTSPNNVWAPGVYGWTLIGPA